LYLITAVNYMFHGIHLEIDDIISTWAGLRPLIHEEGKSASELSRKDETFISESGLISIAGGKLTGYRKMAERVVNIVADKLNEDYSIDTKECTTENIGLVGGPWKNYKEVKKYISSLNVRLNKEGFADYTGWYLASIYGKQAEKILQIYDALSGGDCHSRLVRAELLFCTEFELLHTPHDFFIRRTGKMYFDIESVKQLLEDVLKEYQAVFKVDNFIIDQYRKEVFLEVEKHSKIID